ncbi:MAG TPA: tetratricopeptide repeat protein [Rhizomicrobium sp.]|nr:tetratricopeptide repeat protein [Rhizomicrobium sp.]
MLRLISKITAVFLMGAALAGCASTTSDITKLTGGDTAAGRAAKEAAAAKADKSTPTDLDGGVHQAQLMRYAGQYDDAIRVLSQLMLVASDDPRVVSEYGKTLAQKGRAQDAVQFLNRAVELSSNDWSLYSALGVAYDQLGNQPSAKMAYEHALMLHPEEPSVLNNYALSRMLAGDTAGAHALIARAQAAGGATDTKIAANIALLNKVAPQPEGQQNVATAQKPDAAAPVAPATAAPKPIVAPLPTPAPQASATQATPHAMAQPPVAQVVPRPLAPSQPQAAVHPMVSSLPPGAQPVAPPAASPQVARKPKPATPGVVATQAVPAVSSAAPVNTHAPLAKTAVIKPVDAKPVDVKAAATKPVDTKAVVAKTVDAPKPGSPEQAAVIYMALKGFDGKTGAKTDAKPTVVTADAKPVDAKSANPVPVKTASKDDVPALRLTADARTP